jgi:hypothetical protein
MWQPAALFENGFGVRGLQPVGWSPLLLGILSGVLLTGCGPSPSEVPAGKVAGVVPAKMSVEIVPKQSLTPEEQRRRLEEQSKREAVALYPELGIEGTAVNREYVRRYKLYRSINPEFFSEPDWPKRLADMLATDLGLDPRR